MLFQINKIAFIFILLSALEIQLHTVDCSKCPLKIRTDITQDLSKLASGDVFDKDPEKILSRESSIGGNKSQQLYRLYCTMNANDGEESKEWAKKLARFVLDLISNATSIDLIISLRGIIENINPVSDFYSKLAETNITNDNPGANLSIGLSFNFEGEKCSNINTRLRELLSASRKLNPILNENNHFFSGSVPNFRSGVGLEVNNMCSTATLVDFNIVTIQFRLFMESYGLFKRKMDQIHHQLLKNESDKTSGKIIYYLKLEWDKWQVSEQQYLHDLKKLSDFAEIWSSQNCIDIILPVVHQNKERDSNHSFNKFFVIPTVYEGSVTDYDIRQNATWYVAGAAIMEKFSTLLLTYSQWSDMIQNILPDTQVLPNIMIAIGDSYPPTETLEDDLKTKIMKHKLATKYVKKVAILLDSWVIRSGDESGFETLSRVYNLTKNQSRFLEIGCILKINEFYLFHQQIVTAAQNCKKNGGEFFILKTGIHFHKNVMQDFAYIPVPKNSPLSNDRNINVLTHLSDAKKNYEKIIIELTDVRSAIQKLHPTMEVYTEFISMKEEKREDHVPSSVFCDDDVLNVNEYYEAVLNWARANDFPIILKNSIDIAFEPIASGWISPLLPSSTSVWTTYPMFVMCNYPPTINGWKPDPCISWLNEDTPVVFATDFLYSDVTGAMLKMGLKETQNLSIEEFQTILKFLMYKFSVVEIAIKSFSQLMVFHDTLTPVYIKKLAEYFPSRKLKLYLNCKIKEGEFPIEHVAKFHSSVGKFLANNSVSVDGIHLELPEIKYSLLNSKQFGFVMPGNCLDSIQQAIEHTSELAIDNAKYIVCLDLIDVEKAGSNIQTMRQMFDTHLYIKKLLNKMKPGLGLIFKLELDIELSKYSTISMQQYKRILLFHQEFGTAYDIQYFIVEAFDPKNTVGRRNGWWDISNYTNLKNVDVYTEKDAATQGLPTWKPQENFEKIRAVNGDSKIFLGMTATAQIVTFSGVAFLLIMVATGSFLLVFRYRKMKNLLLTRQEVAEFRSGENNQDGNETHKFSANFELNLNDIAIDFDKILGTGQFGTVFKGRVNGQPAAIKTPHKNCGKETFKSVLGEVKVLCHLGSFQHIIAFIGAYVNEIQTGTLHIATELCENGSLESYLRGKKAIMLRGDVATEAEALSQEMIQFSIEIAKGMEYISNKNVVHGDLATRNVFLDSHNVCKIGDFGLSRKLYEYQKYTKTSQEPLPWKWMAYETLTQMEFTSMSDVWSYAVTVWEIFSIGDIPYAGLNWSPQFPDELMDGLRLTIPQFASQQIYENLQKCWSLDSQQRPTFPELVEFFIGLRSTEYMELNSI